MKIPKIQKILMRKTKKDLIQMLCDIRFVEEMMGYGYTFKQVIEDGEKLDPIRTARIKSLFENEVVYRENTTE